MASTKVEELLGRKAVNKGGDTHSVATIGAFYRCTAHPEQVPRFHPLLGLLHQFPERGMVVQAGMLRPLRSEETNSSGSSLVRIMSERNFKAFSAAKSMD